MHYTFKSKASGDLLMMQPVGSELLRVIGQEPAPEGIIEPAAMPCAIEAIERAIAARRHNLRCRSPKQKRRAPSCRATRP